MLLLLSTSAVAQRPDEEMIANEISNPTSPFYYPNLMLKYEQGETLSKQEFHFLYYGFTYSEDYKPLNTNPHMDRVKNIMSRLAIDTPSVSDIDELILAATDAMERDPFSPELLNILAYAYGTSGDKEREKLYFERLQAVFDCIASSGDGLKEKSAMHVIMFSHALDYMTSKGWNHLKARIISKEVEFVPFDFPHKKVKGLYFDYSRIYRNKPENYVFKRERTWQFNNLKPRYYKK